MKLFVRKVCIFSAIILISFSALDWWYSKALINSHERKYEAWYDLMHGKIDADIIICGSSRAWVHISPQILDSVLNTSIYNLGIDGSQIMRQIRKYRLFRRYNVRPSLIIQNIDVHTMYKGNSYEREQFFPYFWNYDLRKEFCESESISFPEKYIPLFRYDFTFNFSPLKRKSKYLDHGYKGMDRIWNGKKYNEVDSITFSYDKIAFEEFDEFLQEVINDGVKIVFVYAPIYIGATRKMTNLNEMYLFYQKIADKYHIPILDYTYMDICSDTTYFYNANHLNKRGAEIFSDSLAHDLQSLMSLNGKMVLRQ